MMALLTEEEVRKRVQETMLDLYPEPEVTPIAPELHAADVKPVAPTRKDFRTIALRSAARGESRVLPIAVGGKHPLMKWKDSELDIASATDWNFRYEAWIDEVATKFPDANVAVVAKLEEHLFIDEDESAEFRAGYERFAGKPFPRTFTTSARANRAQSHWKQTDATRKMGNVGQTASFSVRQQNQYVLAEGSLHKNGVDVYRVIDDSSVVEMPDSLVEYILSVRKREQPPSDVVLESILLNGTEEEKLAQFLASYPDESIQRGTHDSTLTSIAGKLRQTFKMDADRMKPLLVSICERCCVGYGSDYVEMCDKIANSVARYEIKTERTLLMDGRPVGTSGPKAEKRIVDAESSNSASASGAKVTRMNTFTKKKTRWLWEGRIPLGAMSTIAGDPDQGKSLVTLYIAARITKGESFYGDANLVPVLPPSDVLILSAEDDPESTLAPRLEAAGAELSRVLLLESVMVTNRKGESLSEREAQLDQDIKEIERILAENTSIKLIIIDPISSFLGETASMIKEQEVRKVLRPLKEITQKLGISVILVAHFNKNTETKSAIDRVGGAKAIVGYGRAAWTCMSEPKPENPNELPPDYDPHRHLFLKLKNNLAPSNIGGLIYTIKDADVEVLGDEGLEIVKQPYILWLDQTDSVAQDLLIDGRPIGKGGKSDSAKAWLMSNITAAGGYAKRDDVIIAASKAGHTERTLLRAKGELALESEWVGRTMYWAIQNLKVPGDGGLISVFSKLKAELAPEEQAGHGGKRRGSGRARSAGNTVSLEAEPVGAAA